MADGFEEGEIAIPTVLYATNASTCAGQLYDAYNLIGGKAAVLYENNDMLYHYKTSNGFTYVFDDAVFKSATGVTQDATYTFTYSSSQWDLVKDAKGTTTSTSNVNMATYGITDINGLLEDDDKIFVAYKYGVLLPNNVSQTQYTDVIVDKY